MKEKFESILLQLKSNLKSDSVIDELSTEKDKELHERLINVINRYYENIDLFDKQKDSLQKLLFENANNLLSNTNSGIFGHYLPNYRNYANFLVDNYYKNENNSITTQISMKKTQQENEKLIEKIKEQYENLNISQNSLSQINEKEFEKRYKRLVSLLNYEDMESNLILYTKAENKPFKLYKNSNNSIFIKADRKSVV